ALRFIRRLRPPPRSTLFPYTTLFRSRPELATDDNFNMNSKRVNNKQLLRTIIEKVLMEKSAKEVLSLLEENKIANAQLNTMNQRSEEHTSELQSRFDLVCRLLLEKKK